MFKYHFYTILNNLATFDAPYKIFMTGYVGIVLWLLSRVSHLLFCLFTNAKKAPPKGCPGKLMGNYLAALIASILASTSG